MPGGSCQAVAFKPPPENAVASGRFPCRAWAPRTALARMRPRSPAGPRVPPQRPAPARLSARPEMLTAMRPALKSGLLPVWRDRDTLQIGIDPRRAVALTGMAGLACVISLLDGSRERAQLLQAAAESTTGCADSSVAMFPQCNPR